MPRPHPRGRPHPRPHPRGRPLLLEWTAVIIPSMLSNVSICYIFMIDLIVLNIKKMKSFQNRIIEFRRKIILKSNYVFFHCQDITYIKIVCINLKDCLMHISLAPVSCEPIFWQYFYGFGFPEHITNCQCI